MDPRGRERARHDWFAKYVVARVTEKDLVAEGTTMVTNYEYLGGAGWRYNDDELVAPEHRTWSRYRGYEKVLVTRGDHTDPQVIRSATQYQYFRGLDGDHLPTSTRRSSITESRAGRSSTRISSPASCARSAPSTAWVAPRCSSTIDDPYQLQTAGGNGPLRSYHVDIAASRTRTAVPGGERKTLTEYTYNDDGLVNAVNDLGDESTADDDQCERTEYARDEAAWRLDLPSRQTTVAAACSATPVLPRDAISEERTYYDGRALGEPHDHEHGGARRGARLVQRHDPALRHHRAHDA